MNGFSAIGHLSKISPTCVLIFSTSREMDGEDKHDVRLENRPQVSESAWEYSEPTDAGIKHENIYSMVAADCELSTDIPTRCMDDYNILKGIQCAHERPEDTQADTDYNRQGDGIRGHMVKCLPGVKGEEHRQELNEQSHVIPFHSTDDGTSLTCDVKVKQEDKEDTDGYDRRYDATRHWSVCHGGVLKEVKAEHTSDVSDILSVEGCNENVGRKPSTHTCRHHNDLHDEQINVKLCTTCDLPSSEVRRHDNVLKVHTKTCTGGKHLMCDTRGKAYADLSQHKVTERTHTCVKHFTCDSCGKSFAQSGHLNVHKRIHSGVKPFTCDTCGKLFAQSGHLKTHKMKHTCVKYFTCDTCGKAFADSGHLNVHKRTHTGVKPFMCDTCGKSFAQSGNLNAHKMTHTGVKPFTCDTCGKSFARSGNFNMHKRTHAGVKPFTCGKSFDHSVYLKTHKRTHICVKPFTCDTCGKSFADSRYLNVHKRIHTGVKPFTCDTCGKSFEHLGHFKRHKTTHTLFNIRP